MSRSITTVLVGVQKINLPESTVVKSETSPPAWPAGGTHHGEHSGLRTAAAAAPEPGAREYLTLAEAADLLKVSTPFRLWTD